MSQIKNNEIEGNATIGRHVAVGGNATVQGNANIKKNLKVEGWLEAKNIKGANKGLFASLSHLSQAYPQPHDGWFAGVPASEQDISDLGLTVQAGKALYRMYVGIGGEWVCKPLDKLYEIVVDNEKVETLQEDLATLEAEHTALEKRVDGHDTEISSIETQQATLAATISTNKQATDKALGDLERRADDQDAQIDVLEQYEAENERLAKKGINDASAAQSAAEKAQSSADKLETAVDNLDDRVEEIINAIDSAGGLAVLDDEGYIKKENLPPGIGDVKEFHSKVRQIKLEDAISQRKATDAGCLLVYNEDSKRFVLAVSISDVIEAEEWHQVTHPLQSESKYMKTTGKGLQAGGAQNTGIAINSNWIIANGEVLLNQWNFKYYPVWADQALYGTFSQDGAKPESNKIYICTSDNKGYWWNDGELKCLDAGTDGNNRNEPPAIININELCGEPKATGYYTFWTAIEALAALEENTQVTYRKAGMVITYRVSATEWKTLQLSGELADFGQRASWTEWGGGTTTLPEGGTLELTDDEGTTLNITIPWTSTLAEGAPDSGYGYYGYYGYYYDGYNYIGEWDEPAALELSAAEAAGQEQINGLDTAAEEGGSDV